VKKRIHILFAAQHQDPYNVKREVCEVKLKECRKTSTGRMRDLWYDMVYLFTAIGLPPGGNSTVHIYTQTIHRTTQNKQYT
jgi:hypothetical protein